MSEPERLSNLPPPLVAAVGWFVPGGGYLVIGDRARALVAGSAIVALYLLGLLVGGVRVIEVPGYDSQTGAQIRSDAGGRIIQVNDRDYPNAGWALTHGRFVAELANKPWFVPQFLAGPICLASAAGSVSLAQQPDHPRPHSHLETIGTLYTAIAGMLNLMIMIDAAHRAGQPAPEPEVAV